MIYFRLDSLLHENSHNAQNKKLYWQWYIKLIAKTVLLFNCIDRTLNQSINQTNYFIVRLKVDQRAGQLSLPHLGITKTEKNSTKT